MVKIEFKSEEKIELFSNISELYFNNNFGTLSKSELELMLFTFYYRKRKVRKLSVDDFTISTELGITQNRVRSFKEKMALRNNEYNDDWKETFKELLYFLKYDDVKKMFKLHIPDINVLIQLRQFLESKNLYDEYQLNPKLFQCRADVMLELLKELYPDELNNEELPRIKEIEVLSKKDSSSLTAIEKFKIGKTEEGIKDLLSNCGKEVAIEILNLIPGGNIISALINAISK